MTNGVIAGTTGNGIDTSSGSGAIAINVGITNTTLSNIGGVYGLFNEQAAQNVTLSNNTFNNVTVSVPANTIGQLITGSHLTGNSGIRTVGGTLAANATWGPTPPATPTPSMAASAC